MQVLDRERFNPKKLNSVEVRGQYEVKSQIVLQLWETWVVVVVVVVVVFDEEC
jgi:hypothetical protein